MNGVYEELDEVKAENQKLRTDCKSKEDMVENLKRVHSDQLLKIQEANLKIEKQAQELNEKEEEISSLRQMFEDLKSTLNEKESILKRVKSINDKLRVDCEEKCQMLKEENGRLFLALDEANEKNIDQGQQINVYKAEIEGLKGLLSTSQNKCIEAERKAKAPKELRERDDMLLKLEEENSKVEDQLKWKKEQFKHLEEAHENLHGQFRSSKKEWELEKCTLLDEISSLQASLDSQTRISEDLKNQLQRCNQALAHEETRRKYLEVQVSEFKTRYEDVFAECQDTKSQLDDLTVQRDKEIATLRHSLSTKDTLYKEIKYQAGKLEQENQELLTSLRELQEARIQEAGSPSLAKLQKKLKSVEQMHKNCSTNLRNKEAEWSSQLEKVNVDLNNYRSQLEGKDKALKRLEMELEGCHSSAMQLKLQNEEISMILMVLKSAIADAQSKLANDEAERHFHEKDEEMKFMGLTKQLEMKNTALAKAQKDIEEEREKTTALLRRVECLNLIEDQHLQTQKEIDRYTEMLEESSSCQVKWKEQALQLERDSRNKLQEVCDVLDVANSKLAEERAKVASLSMKVESFNLVEEQKLLLQKELERYKERLEESSRCQLHLEEQISMMKSDSREKHKVCDALEIENSKLGEECEKTESLAMKVESFNHTEEQLLLMQKELQQYKEMLEESTTHQLLLEKQLLQVESDSKKRLLEVSEALERVNHELVEQISESHQIKFESWVWKSIAERLKADLEDYQELRKELEASLLVQVEVAETIKQDKYGLFSALEEKDNRIGGLQQQIVSLEKELETRELEAVSSARMEREISFKSEKESILRITREKEQILENLQKEIRWLEQESLRRELEGAVFAHIGAERIFQHEKDNLVQLVQQKDQKIDDLMLLVKSLEEKFDSSLKTSSLQLAEKEAEVYMVYQAWEKIARAEIFAQLEIEEKKLMILELEEDIHSVQQKLERQGESLSHLKQQSSKTEAELEIKQLEMKKLADPMQAKVRASDALIDELNCEKRNLLEDIIKLSSERENLLCFIEGLGDRICKFSNEDMQLMEVLGSIVQPFHRPSEAVKSNGELFELVKENINTHPLQTTKKIEEDILEGRSPFRQLN